MVTVYGERVDGSEDGSTAQLLNASRRLEEMLASPDRIASIAEGIAEAKAGTGSVVSFADVEDHDA